MYQPHQGPGEPPPGFAPPSPPWVVERAKKKRRIVLILMAVVVASVLIGGGITGGIFASQYYESTGRPPTSSPVPRECEALRQTMERIGVPNVTDVKVTPPSAAATSSTYTFCTWQPSPAEHVRSRSMYVLINAFTGPEADRQASDYHPPTKGEIVPLPEIPDRAWFRVERSGSAYSVVDLWAQRGTIQLWIMYSGRDKGFFADERVPQDVLVGEVKTVAETVFEKLSASAG